MCVIRSVCAVRRSISSCWMSVPWCDSAIVTRTQKTSKCAYMNNRADIVNGMTVGAIMAGIEVPDKAGEQKMYSNQDLKYDVSHGLLAVDGAVSTTSTSSTKGKRKRANGLQEQQIKPKHASLIEGSRQARPRLKFALSNADPQAVIKKLQEALDNDLMAVGVLARILPEAEFPGETIDIAPLATV